MAAPSPPRPAAVLALSLALSVSLLAARAAHAQSAGPAPAPPPYGGYAPYAAPPYGPAVPVFMERNSTGMMAGGITLITVGSVGSIIGAALLAAGTTHSYEEVPCAPTVACLPARTTNGGLTAAGATVVAISTAALIAGIPLLAVGTRKVPARNEPTALLPELRVGVTGAALRWQF